MGRDDGRAVLGRDREVLGVGEAADVVADHGAGRQPASSTDARQVSTETGVSNRAVSASTAGTTRSSSSSSPTSGPGPAFTPPTSSRSAPASTRPSARARKASKSQVAPRS